MERARKQSDKPKKQTPCHPRTPKSPPKSESHPPQAQEKGTKDILQAPKRDRTGLNGFSSDARGTLSLNDDAWQLKASWFASALTPPPLSPPQSWGVSCVPCEQDDVSCAPCEQEACRHRTVGWEPPTGSFGSGYESSR